MVSDFFLIDLEAFTVKCLELCAIGRSKPYGFEVKILLSERLFSLSSVA